jgi:hypothetical protein
MEATCEDARAPLGIETQRQWSDKATARTTPVLLALYSIVTLIAAHLPDTNTMPVRAAAWYRKEAATFSDTIALVRRWLWAQDHFDRCPVLCRVNGQSRAYIRLPHQTGSAVKGIPP